MNSWQIGSQILITSEQNHIYYFTRRPMAYGRGSTLIFSHSPTPTSTFFQLFYPVFPEKINSKQLKLEIIWLKNEHT